MRVSEQNRKFESILTLLKENMTSYCYIENKINV